MIRAAIAGATLLVATPLAAQPAAPWVASWTAAQQSPEPIARLPDDRLAGATLRQALRLSLGGARLRIVLANDAGDAPLQIAGVHIARAVAGGSPVIEVDSDHAVTFGGRAIANVPAHGRLVSDPVDLATAPLARLSVSIRFAQAPAQQTGHPGSRSTSWLAPGDQVAAATLTGAVRFEHWWQLAGIEVEAPGAAGAVVALGDSITDGRGSDPDRNDRWPDLLAERLQAAPGTRGWAVANEGLGGNRLLADGIGPSALARFDRDVLAQPDVRCVVLLEGINDLGQFTRAGPQPPPAHLQLRAKIIGAYQQLIARAHARGIRIVGATILPDGGNAAYHPTPLGQADRRAINDWIRQPGHFDAVIDWDAAMRDPADPDRLRPSYDSNDHLHPSRAGYQAMAAAIRLEDLLP